MESTQVVGTRAAAGSEGTTVDLVVAVAVDTSEGVVNAAARIMARLLIRRIEENFTNKTNKTLC
uniref:Uncharacterized protein n=1 Tax=Nelumbo nucifera TaxID=4432 RepID=A0A822Z074_NELNU|nr:TPA_asm: hypothetical protein HUJ06_007037 [Nelumbo nucifera]